MASTKVRLLSLQRIQGVEKMSTIYRCPHAVPARRALAPREFRINVVAEDLVRRSLATSTRAYILTACPAGRVISSR